MARAKFVEIVTVVELNYKLIQKRNHRIIEVVDPNIPSRKISLRKNVDRKGKTFFVPNLQYCPFKQDDWENRTYFRKNLAIEKIFRQIFSCS